MIVVGIHTGHDGSIAVVRDGRLVASMALERLDRNKKSHGVTSQLLDLVLTQAGVTVEDIDCIALSDWKAQWGRGVVEVFGVDCTWNQIFGDDWKEFSAVIGGRTVPAYNIGHHMAHCAGAFFTSPFERAICMSMDSSGGHIEANSCIAFGAGTALHFMRCPALMSGVLYGQVTEYAGLGSQGHKAGSLMGLAPYGTVLPWVRDSLDRIIEKCVHPGAKNGCEYWGDIYDLAAELTGSKKHRPQDQADSIASRNAAASVQFIFEQSILQTITTITEQPEISNICLAGGSFLNCNINSRIATESRFKNVHLAPPCGDDGLAAGAALYVAHHILGGQRVTYTPREIAYQGPDHEQVQEMDHARIAELVAAGKVVGLFQGRAECGPRALGNRSILADPRDPMMRDHINFKVKKREWFRPFAPTVLSEHHDEWFDGPSNPFMLMTSVARNPEAIPAVVHVDNTSRVQRLERATNPDFYAIIEQFHAMTGVPMVLNTSLNGPGEPILESDSMARDEFMKRVQVDAMVVNGEVIER